MKYFKDVEKVNYEGPESKNPMAFKYYNPDEVVMGKTMKEQLRFAMSWWHTFTYMGEDQFGVGTMFRPWDQQEDPMAVAKERVYAAFEFMEKMQIPFFCFHDVDIAPKGKDLAETNANLDEIVAVIKQESKKTGIKCLWGTTNAFSDPRFVHGAGTSCNSTAFALAAAQIKKAMEITKELGGENYVFWGGREGYMSLLNTDMKRELDHLGQFLTTCKDYARKQGFKGTFLIEPKPMEPTKHQYDYDAATSLRFINQYGLKDDFKLNLEVNHATLAGHTFEHELQVAVDAGMLGSIDANRGDYQNGWDTDQFPIDIFEITQAMLIILEGGGLQGGGINFDAKVRRNSTDLEDKFIAHIAGMDVFARGLICASHVLENTNYKKIRENRYASFDSGKGAEFEKGVLTLEDLSSIAREKGEPAQISGKQELLEQIIANAF